MAKTDTVKPTAAPVQTPVPPTPKEGGSYTLDDTTGEHTLIERTQENTEPRSRT